MRERTIFELSSPGRTGVTFPESDVPQFELPDETLLRKEIAQASASKQTAFLNLIYKSLKVDTQLNRTKAFVKRLLQV